MTYKIHLITDEEHTIWIAKVERKFLWFTKESVWLRHSSYSWISDTGGVAKKGSKMYNKLDKCVCAYLVKEEICEFESTGRIKPDFYFQDLGRQ